MTIWAAKSLLFREGITVMWKSTERTGELVISGITFCVGFVGILMSRDMPKGEYSVPGPGVFPALLGILLCGVSLGLTVQILLRHKPAKKVVEIGNRYIWATTAAIIGISFLFERLGFILVMAFFVGFLLRLLSNLRWIACILWAFVASIAAYGFFHFLLGVQLPSARWF
jgi:putative tricarboxylic transport membrane protein